jgi:hypothetical protein
VYSLGVLLHYLVTGAFPYEGASVSELHAAHQRPRELKLSDRRPGLSPEFVQAIERALDPNPKRRYQTAGEFRQALVGGQTDAEPGSVRTPVWMRYAATLAIGALAIWGASQWVDRGFDVEAHVYRYEDATQRSELLSGAGVEVGDRLTLELETSRSLYVYVLNEDDTGRAYVLFPIDESTLENPLAKGTHELPGPGATGDKITWTVSSVGGRERLLIVASKDRVPEIEEAIEALPQASTGYASLDAAVLRGIGGLSPLDSGSQEGETSIPGIQELLDGQQRSRDRWVRQFVLSNP